MFTETPKTVVLNNGTEEKELLVASVVNRLNTLFNSQSAAFFAAIGKAGDSGYKCSLGSVKVLKNFDLVDDRGVMHPSIGNIVRASVEGEHHKAKLINPLMKP